MSCSRTQYSVGGSTNNLFLNTHFQLVFTLKQIMLSDSGDKNRRVLWEELLEEVILHITPLCSLLHTLLKDKCMCLQGK